VTFDVANVLQRGEDPVAATHRVARYVRQTHLKDFALMFAEDGIVRQARPCGQGVVDYEAILPLLFEHNPSINLTIENSSVHSRGLIDIWEPVWMAAHPDLPPAEVAQFFRLVKGWETRAARGETPTFDAYEANPHDYDHSVRFIKESAAHVRAICARIGLDPEARHPRREVQIHAGDGLRRGESDPTGGRGDRR
jgi:hypothetical protein